MAFSDAQKAKIRDYLGVTGFFPNLTTRLESAMNQAGGIPVEQTQIEAWLTRIAAIDAALTGESATTSSLTLGAVKSVEEIEFYDVGENGGSVAQPPSIEQGRILIMRLAKKLGVDDILPNGDYFSATKCMSFPI